MNSTLNFQKIIDIGELDHIEVSSNASSNKSKDRLNLLKKLSTKNESIIDHLKNANEIRPKSSTLFHSDKWDFKSKN